MASRKGAVMKKFHCFKTKIQCILLALLMSSAFLNASGCTPAVGPSVPASFSPEASVLAQEPAVPSFHPPEGFKMPDEPEADPVKAMINSMSNEELLGQMIMVGFTGTKDLSKSIAGMVKKYKIGNIILFGWNTSNFTQTKKMIANIKKHNPFPRLPLLIALDVEGGSVRRFSWKPRIYSAMELGKQNKPKKVYDQFLYIGKKLKSIGVNANLAPVLDIAHKPANSFLKKRMYGSNPKKVIPLTNMAVKGLQDADVISVGKHFPGEGMTKTDSHRTLPVIKTPRKEIFDYTLKPFQAASDIGIGAMMVGHILVPALDNKNPATLSKSIITGLLREQMGFDGLIFSDDMRMGAIVGKYNIGEACIRFIEAGGDIVIIGKNLKLETAALKALSESVKSGRLSRKRMEESVYRIIKAKMKLM